MSNQPRPQLFASASPVVTRIIPVLAKAIGLNESIVLMQIAYLISIASDENYHDGKWWTYQSVRHLQSEYFPYWSVMTVNRAINELTDKTLLIDGNYNKLSYDKTRWFALNDAEINKLGVVVVVYQNDTALYQNVTRKQQNDTTIPETTTKNTTKEHKEIVPATHGTPTNTDDDALPKKPRSAKQLANDALVDALGKALGIIAVGKDYGNYLKVAQDIVAAGIVPDEFALFVGSVKREAAGKWKVTPNSLTINGRMSEYVKTRKPAISNTPDEPDDSEDTASYAERRRLNLAYGAMASGGNNGDV
jgi:hypothetical protein